MSSPKDSLGIDLSTTFAPIYWGYFYGVSDLFSLVTVTSLLKVPCRFMDLASSALIAQSVYYYLRPLLLQIPNFGSLLPLNSVTPSQIYFVYKLYIVKGLEKGRWLVLGTIVREKYPVFLVKELIVPPDRVVAPSWHSLVVLTFFGFVKGFGTLADLLATIAMCMYLTASRTGISELVLETAYHFTI
ncbi:hypothetical protein C0995_009075 [Termitomyces sp. Mi166|nr:hypothetical protein C0995_009075 [Termitomyces sp. Mi166\